MQNDDIQIKEIDIKKHIKLKEGILDKKMIKVLKIHFLIKVL